MEGLKDKTDFMECGEEGEGLERMFHAICDTSTNAFFYKSSEMKRARGLGNWNHFFESEPEEGREDECLCEGVDDGKRRELQAVLHLEDTEEIFKSLEYYNYSKKIWVECEATATYQMDGELFEKVVRFRDITKFKQQNEELAYMAYYDTLTGLYNRNYFVSNLNKWIQKAEEEEKRVSVLFIDIDDFRRINDGQGMLVGDELIQQIGQYLGGYKSQRVMISHFNSDLYCMAIYHPIGCRSVEYIYNSICERMKTPFTMTNGNVINTSLSIGAAEYPEAGKTALDLINNAEIVMFQAKKIGHGTIQYFEAPILKEFLRTVSLENKLKSVASTEQGKSFMMYYQPQYDVLTGKLRGVEALIRWKDETGNMISPSVFIPLAEKNGTIIPIGQWVLEESISTFAHWREKYGYEMVLSVNISAIQYKKKDFVDVLLALLKQYHMDPKELELEITESILIDDFDEIIKKMKILRKYGIRVSLDDFGTGYSSLSYLKGLPIDTLKIDKSFIDTVVSDEPTKIITQSIVSMVKQLGFETVAEGVETEEQMAYLQAIHCDNIQGFLLGKPMPSEEVEQLLKKMA